MMVCRSRENYLPSCLRAMVVILFFTLFPLGAFTQPADNHYSLTGDDVLIEVAENDARYFHGIGNVHLTYTYEGKSWSIDADEIEFTEENNPDGSPLARHAHAEGNVVAHYSWAEDTWSLSAGMIDLGETYNSDSVVIAQSANAERNIAISGPGIDISAPGKLVIDILNRRASFNSTDIHFVFPGGELVTDSLEMSQETVTDENGNISEITIVNTAVRTEAVYKLSESAVFDNNVPNPSAGSLFSDIQFGFSEVTIETDHTTLEVVDGEPVELDCPDPTTVTSHQNTLILPSCVLTFDPPTLTGNDGVELHIGTDIVVASNLFILSHPPDGSMHAEFTGYCTIDPTMNDDAHRVVITHPSGIFRADVIKITIKPDGTHRIEASGCTSAEIPFPEFTGE